MVSACGSSLHVPSAVPCVDLSDIPDGTLGEWLCKHTIHDLLYWVQSFHSLTDIDHLPLLIVALTDIVYKWEHLGMQLGLKYWKLKVIERSKRGIRIDCMIEMLEAWLQDQGGECSKQALKTALQKIGCSFWIDLAICERVCTLCLSNGCFWPKV